jgi:hypothetical protein
MQRAREDIAEIRPAGHLDAVLSVMKHASALTCVPPSRLPLLDNHTVSTTPYIKQMSANWQMNAI